LQALGKIVGIEYDGGDRDRTRERAAPDFVDAGDPARAELEPLSLESEIGLRRFQASGPLPRRARSKA
jgi:hypothetical protein